MLIKTNNYIKLLKPNNYNVYIIQNIMFLMCSNISFEA